MQSTHTNAETGTAQVSRTIWVKDQESLGELQKSVNNGEFIVDVRSNGYNPWYLVTLSNLPVHHRQVWGESFDEYTKRVFSGIQ